MIRLALILALIGAPLTAGAEPVRVAVAANFLMPLERLTPLLTDLAGVEIEAVSGSTGQLYAQIVRAAPYDLFLAADAARPAAVVAAGRAASADTFTYALGRLVALSARGPAETVLRSGDFDRLAIANPAVAPYGVAAVEVLAALAVEVPSRRRVLGGNVAQAYQFFATGNVDVALVSAALAGKAADGGDRWLVPAHLHRPIVQDGVVLDGLRRAAAHRLAAALTDPAVQRRLAEMGYDPVPDGGGR